MAKNILFIAISLLSISILFTSCDDETNPLVGTWEYTEIAFSNCDDPNNNGIFNYSGNGYCETTNNEETCIKLSLVITATSYRIQEMRTVGDVETIALLEEGTYKLVEAGGNNIQFCTDILCRGENYKIIDGVLSRTYIDANSGCSININARK